MLEGKRVDLVPGNRNALYEMINRMPELKNLVAITPQIDEIPSYIAFTRERDLTAVRNAFDVGIRQMKDSGRYDEIIRSYGSSDP